jgi:hypothetical protein
VIERVLTGKYLVGTAAISSFVLNEVSTCHKTGARQNKTTNAIAIGNKIFRQGIFAEVVDFWDIVIA